MFLFSDATIYLRPRKSADNKPQPYKKVVAKNCKLEWDVRNRDLGEFLKGVAGVCVSSQGVRIGSSMLACSGSKSNPGEWLAFINSTTGFGKGEGVVLTEALLPKMFAKMIEFPTRKAGIIFSMKNPDKCKDDLAIVRLSAFLLFD